MWQEPSRQPLAEWPLSLHCSVGHKALRVLWEARDVRASEGQQRMGDSARDGT